VKKAVRLHEWEKDVLRQLFYMAPEGGETLSLSEAAERAVGPDRVHPDNLQALAKKLVTLGYGQGEARAIQIPSFDVDFKLNSIGFEAASSLVRTREYRSPIDRMGRVNWATIAAIISAVAAIASAIFAYRVGK
jgi:hypothetical protein